MRKWQTFLTKFAVLLVTVSGELPFPDGLDLRGTSAALRYSPSRFRRVARLSVDD
jgi:amidase